MEYICVLIVSMYGSFVIGRCYEMYKAHKKWEEEVLPLRREVEKLKALLHLSGAQY